MMWMAISIPQTKYGRHMMRLFVSKGESMGMMEVFTTKVGSQSLSHSEKMPLKKHIHA